MRSVKVLALQFHGPDLNAVLGILRCFPNLEKLYVIWDAYVIEMKNVWHQYDPVDPIKCLESHLKLLVLKNYQGVQPGSFWRSHGLGRELYCFCISSAIPTSEQQQSPIHALEGMGAGKGKYFFMAPPSTKTACGATTVCNGAAGSTGISATYASGIWTRPSICSGAAMWPWPSGIRPPAGMGVVHRSRKLGLMRKHQ